MQVEHGVTELVFDVDLVRWMVELAAGELPPLDELTANLEANGCAMQARLCAEDPHQGFCPSPGTASVVSFPAREGVRVDTWLRSGTEIPPLYDSLVAKVMAHAASRDLARRHLADALRETVAFGVQTNRDYLRQALASAPFADARHDTALWRLSATSRARSRYWQLAFTPPCSLGGSAGLLAGGRAAVRADGRFLVFASATDCLATPKARRVWKSRCKAQRCAFRSATTVCVAGFCELNIGTCWQPFDLAPGDVLTIGKVTRGVRAYLLVAGGSTCRV